MPRVVNSEADNWFFSTETKIEFNDDEKNLIKAFNLVRPSTEPFTICYYCFPDFRSEADRIDNQIIINAINEILNSTY